MPLKKTIKRAQKAKRSGKSASTQASEFVREEMDRIREGKTGAKSPQQAIAIGLSKARQSGVKIPSQKGGKTPTRNSHIHKKKVSAKRSRAGEKRMKKESKRSASHNVLSLNAHKNAMKRSAKSRHLSALKAARTRKRNEKKAA